MNKRKKIIHFTVSPGGIKRHILDIVTGLDPTRFESIGIFIDEQKCPSLIRDSRGTYGAIFSEIGLKCYLLDFPRHLNPIKDIKAFFTLVRILKQEKPDVLHCHSSKAGAVGRLATFFCRVPLVLYTPQCMYFPLQRGLKRLVFQAIEKILYRATDYVIAVSPSEYQEMTGYFGQGQRLIQINNGVAIEGLERRRGNQEEIRRSLNLPRDCRIILSITRLEPSKNVVTLMRAFRSVKLQHPEAWLLIAGDGDQLSQLEQSATELGIADQTLFLGWRDDVPELITASDVVVLTSLKEGLPYALLEAAALAKPLVGSDAIGTRDVVLSGQTGFLFEIGDHAALAMYIGNLLGDRDLSTRLGQNAHKLVRERYNLTTMIQKYTELYDQDV